MMYIPKKFIQTDSAKLKKAIREYPFATLVSNTDLGCDAEHLPLMLIHKSGKDFLHGHIAKANPLWQQVKNNAEVLAIFHGPNCYISPNVYPSKQLNGRAVPTWNYAVVHVRGVVTFIHHSQWKLSMLSKLTEQHEISQPKAWQITDAPNEYIEKMLPAIVGIEVEITSIIGKWKISQNQSEENQRGVCFHLAQENTDNSTQVAKLIKQNLDEHFN